MPSVTIDFDLDEMLNDGKLSVNDLVDCLCGDFEWAKEKLSRESVTQLMGLISRLDVRTPDEEKYDRLVYAVCTKFPGEERFETALRYIMESERRTSEGGSQV